MTQIKKILDKQGNEVFIRTSTKAVVDENGYTAESRLQAMQDEINQAQLEVGAVPSDLTPTENSTNWVTSGGVYNTICFGDANVNIDITEYSAVNGWITSSTNKWNTNYTCRFIPIKAGTSYIIKAKDSAPDIMFAFMINNIVGNHNTTVTTFADGVSDPTILSQGQKVEVVAPLNAAYLWVTNEHSDDRLPEYVIEVNKVKINEFLDNTDSKPTYNSSNLVTSGGVYSAINGIDDFTDINLGEYELVSKTINSSNVWYNGGDHYLIPCEDYSDCIVKAHPSLGSIIAYFDSTSTSGSVPFVDETLHVLTPGQVYQSKIPVGTKYLYVTNFTNEKYITPQSISLGNRKVTLNDMIFGDEYAKPHNVNDIINLEDYTNIDGRIIYNSDRSRIWQTGSEFASARIPVVNIAEIEVQSNGSQAARISFTRETETSGNPSLAQNSKDLSITGTVKLKVPYDARFIIVDKRLSTGDSRVPTYIKVTQLGEIHYEYKIIQRNLHYDDVLQNLRTARFNINGHNGEGVLTFLVTTDMHGSVPTGTEFYNITKYFENFIDFSVSLGDNVEVSYSDSFAYWDTCDLGHVWNLIGNHDSRLNGNWSGAGHENCYNRYIAPYIANWNVTTQDSSIDPYACYYYKDFTKQSKTIRVIVTDTMFVDDVQLAWLEARLTESITNSYSVVILCHYPSCNNPSSYINTETNAYWSTIDYKNFTGSGVPASQVVSMVDVVSDFIDGGGELVCWINGHRHYDEIGYSSLDSRILNITLEKSASSYGSANEDSQGNHEGARIHNELSQNSFTFVTIDPTYKLIKLVRLGNTINNYMRSKKYLCYDYANKEIIGQG